MTTIISKIRNLIQDLLITTGRDVFDYTTSKVWSLTEGNVVSATILVYKNGILWSNTNYSYSSTTGKLTVTGTLIAGDTLEVLYSYYSKYSDTELTGWIRSALSYLSVEQYKTFSIKSDSTLFPSPTEAEENLIAVIASILIKGDIVSYKTPEITVTFERGDSKEKKIKKLIKQFNKAFGIIEYIDYDEKLEDSEEIDEL